MHLLNCFVADGTLTYCLVFPTAMVHLQSIASVLAFDIVAETKIECWATGFSYFKRIQLASVAPLAIVAAIVGCSVLWASCTVPDAASRRRLRIADRDASSASVAHDIRKAGCCVRGLWTAAPVALFALDLLYPAITRVLFNFFTCRNLGDAGRWLEVDYAARQYFAEHLTATKLLRCYRYDPDSHCRSVLCDPMAG